MKKATEPVNTRINYLYRDANNFKYSSSVVVEGCLKFQQLKKYLDEGLYFVPADVGLPGRGRRRQGPPDPGLRVKKGGWS